jgi:hypothetical protein
MSLRDAEEAALLLAVIFKRSGVARARVSDKTLKLLGYRQKLRISFADRINAHLSDLGMVFIELETGGYGLMPSKALEAAKVITAKKWMNEEELDRLKNGQPFDIKELWRELEEDDGANVIAED